MAQGAWPPGAPATTRPLIENRERSLCRATSAKSSVGPMTIERAEVAMPELWAGVDVGKEHHHCVVINARGERLLSRRVLNDETALL
ncbi:IS110 family transposase, partial [Amycolatopsis nivea]|uniref:IS110 family transposase n=1 Tax=Amycolatopsis nivea TaxID=1644109 RepID=UPI003F6A687C